MILKHCSHLNAKVFVEIIQPAYRSGILRTVIEWCFWNTFTIRQRNNRVYRIMKCFGDSEKEST